MRVGLGEGLFCFAACEIFIKKLIIYLLIFFLFFWVASGLSCGTRGLC